MMKRGNYGVDALCRWLEAIVRDFGISKELLSGKVDRIREALVAR